MFDKYKVYSNQITSNKNIKERRFLAVWIAYQIETVILNKSVRYIFCLWSNVKTGQRFDFTIQVSS